MASWAARPMRRRTSCGLRPHVEAGHLRLALVGAGEGGEDAHRGRLAGAVGPEDGGDRAHRHLQVDAVEGSGGAVPLHQAAGVDREAHVGRGVRAVRRRLVADAALDQSNVVVGHDSSLRFGVGITEFLRRKRGGRPGPDAAPPPGHDAPRNRSSGDRFWRKSPPIPIRSRSSSRVATEAETTAAAGSHRGHRQSSERTDPPPPIRSRGGPGPATRWTPPGGPAPGGGSAGERRKPHSAPDERTAPREADAAYVVPDGPDRGRLRRRTLASSFRVSWSWWRWRRPWSWSG